MPANLLDNCRSRAVFHQPQHTHIATVRLDDIGTDHLIDAVITAFDQHVRLDVTQQIFRSAFGEADHPVHCTQACQHGHTPVNAVDRTARPFQAADRRVIVDGHDQTITQRPRLLQVGHMTGVKNVEAAIGEDDFFLVRARIIDRQQQLLQPQHAAFGTFFALNGAAQFRGADGCSTQLADHNACCQISQRHRMRQFLARSNRCRESGNYRVTGAGHIEHFASTGRQVQRLLIRTQQGHAVLTAGHQQSAQVKLLHQLRTFGDQLCLVFTMPDDGFEFTEVRRNQAGTAIDREILALGISQHRYTALAGGLNQRLMVFQRTLAVIGQDQHLDAIQQAVDLCTQCQRVSVERFFEVDTQ
ncbi:hypothetical protein ALQ30_05662 [Pseudomonas syringae pv. persicae]|uniref:Uncharacterized protein n=1 Tax=Pseudomonas syringae pv. persicae TaxID=237306 RepID=A0A3M4ACC9_9PSED|nr:hypothetical protein ALQ30_05662 [Pseudomonas syringae pv. persicae]